MKITRNIEVPTGNILIVEGEHGPLEMLSIGDYGKEVNLKADFMGLTREPEKVRHTKLLPLEEKWVITVSTQYGCDCRCNFCDVPKVSRLNPTKHRNATFDDLVNQVKTGLSLHPEVKYTQRLNIHFARMGEPTFNPNVLAATKHLAYILDDDYIRVFHPVVSTMMPKHNEWLSIFLNEWMIIKNHILGGDAGLQLSINSTDEEERHKMFGGCALTLGQISDILSYIPSPVGRKITLNFAVANYKIDPGVLLKYFNPKCYVVKLTPMHKTATALENNIQTCGDYTTYYPYQEHEEKLKSAGYDTLVFIASHEEDLGRITCGNAILSGTEPFET